MSDLTAFIDRVVTYAKAADIETSTAFRKIVNDGKALERLRSGGTITLKTLDKANAELDRLERALEAPRNRGRDRRRTGAAA